MVRKVLAVVVAVLFVVTGVSHAGILSNAKSKAKKVASIVGNAASDTINGGGNHDAASTPLKTGKDAEKIIPPSKKNESTTSSAAAILKRKFENDKVKGVSGTAGGATSNSTTTVNNTAQGAGSTVRNTGTHKSTGAQAI